jgi:hypothetical protein
LRFRRGLEEYQQQRAEDQVSEGIGTLRENPLHAALKEHYRRAGDRVEEKVGRYVVDIVRDDELVEIQTRNFSAIRPKLLGLLETHRVRLVHPIAVERLLLKLGDDGQCTRRKSPKRGACEDVFTELVSFPELIHSPRFVIEICLTREEQVRVYDENGPWRRRGWRVVEQRLAEVIGSLVIESMHDLVALLPSALETPFTSHEVARAFGRPLAFAQKVCYCLAQGGAVRQIGHRDRARLYEFQPDYDPSG